MQDAPADRWEFSLLVDRANRILEARGLYELYLGARPGQLINRHLVSFVAESGRLAFLRYMARLVVHGEAEPVIVTLATPAVGVKRFAMAAKHGDGAANWWILFAQEDAKAEALETADAPFASTEELALLADAHDHAKAPLDITVFSATGVHALPTERRRAIDDQLGESLLDHAHERLVARPELGEYALLHSRGKDAAEIGESLAAVAELNELPASQLGLRRETRQLPADASASDVILEMRRKIRANERAPVAPPSLPKRLLLAAVAGGCVLVLVLAWLLVRA
jgi:hypothetical protein